MEHLDEILSVPGLSVAYLGPHDSPPPWAFRAMWGILVVQAINAFLRGCKRHNVIPGCG
jgi:hypothetical protein